MTLTKADLVREVCEKREGLTRTQASDAVESFLSLSKGCLIDGSDLLFSVFGKFNIRNKNERKGRNPQTGAFLMLAPRRVDRGLL